MIRALLIFLLVFPIVISSKHLMLYIFNIPIDKSLFIVENQAVWIDKKVLEIINKKVKIYQPEKYYNPQKRKYLLDQICNDYKDQLILTKNFETGIIDLNTIYRHKIPDIPKKDINKGYLNQNLASDYKVVETKYFKVYYTNNQLIQILRNVLDFYVDSIASFVNLSISEFSRIGKIPIYLAPDDEIYKAYNLIPDWSSGAFIFDYNASTCAIYAHERDHFLVQRVLPHEISHLVLTILWKGNIQDETTKFIQEGFAQYNEYRIIVGSDQIVIHPEGKSVNQDELINLLYPSFSAKENIKNFYQNSLSFTSFLICKYGRQKYIEFLNNIVKFGDVLISLNNTYQFTSSKDKNEIIQKIQQEWAKFVKSSSATTDLK
ncbi:MAG: hypothetical protein ABDH21_04505 [bacterium]